MNTHSEKSISSTSSPAAKQTAQEPFFGKRSGGGFFEGAKQGNAPVIQAKLTINQPGDMYEQEADRMADQVVQRLATTGHEMEGPLSTTNHQVPTAIQPKCEACEKEEEIQRKETEGLEEQEEILRQTTSASPSEPGGEAGSDFTSRLNASKGGGSPLSENTRADMESAFGTDFSGVRIHTGGEAASMSKDIRAQAFTHGSDIYFNDGKFDGGSTEGKRLLAHELVHVGQQSTAIQPKRKPKAEDVQADLANGRVQEALGNKFVTDAFRDISDKAIDNQSKKEKKKSIKAFKRLDKALGESVKGDLGLKGINTSEMGPESIASIAFIYGMLDLRQTFIEKYIDLVSAPTDARPKDGNDIITKIQSLNFDMPNQESIDEEPSQSIKEFIVENPDLDTKSKKTLLKSVRPGLTDIEISNLLFGDENQSNLKEKISKKAEFYYYALGGSGEMPDVFLAAVGDTGGSSGLLKSPQRSSSTSAKDTSVGTGYFMYEQNSFNNHIKIDKIASKDASEANALSITISAYGFDANSGKVDANFKIGDKIFTVTFKEGEIIFNDKNLPSDIRVSQHKTIDSEGYSIRTSRAYINIPALYRKDDINIDIRHASYGVDNTGKLEGDEIQLVVAANTLMNTSFGNIPETENNTKENKIEKKKETPSGSPIEARELFESGSFVSKDVSTLERSDKPSEKELAKKIIDFSANLDISKIIGLLTLTEEGETEDFSQLLNLKGTGINENAPIPQSFRKENPKLSNTQLLDKMQKLDKYQLMRYYQIDSGYDEDVTYETIIDSLETYRSSQAKMSEGKIDISSTTDPQGTGINPGENNDFPDYYNYYIDGTLFGDEVNRLGLLKMTRDEETGKEIVSRENNEILSALRSLSFLKLILEQKGLSESDFKKMNVKVLVGSQEVRANLAEIPTEFSVFYSEP